MADVEVTVKVSGDATVSASTRAAAYQESPVTMAADHGGVPVRITVQGLALWIDRGGFYDVLFPNDRITGDDHHYVTWGVPEIAINDAVVDLRESGLVSGDNSTYKSERWISLPIPSDAPAAKAEEVLTNRDACVGVLRLPYGRLSHNHVKFYCKYTGNGLHYWLSSFVDWEGILAGGTTIRARVTDRASSVKSEPQLAARQFAVKCLSAKDRRPPKAGSTNVVDTTDFNMVGVLTSTSGDPLTDNLIHDGTKYPGPSATNNPPFSAMTTGMRMTTDIKLCPSVAGYIVD